MQRETQNDPRTANRSDIKFQSYLESYLQQSNTDCFKTRRQDQQALLSVQRLFSNTAMQKQAGRRIQQASPPATHSSFALQKHSALLNKVSEDFNKTFYASPKVPRKQINFLSRSVKRGTAGIGLSEFSQRMSNGIIFN